ncbi:MotA/TolQ/ExbB proton channel family protein [Pseudemcibacter aquimaris]|uniref:MotA/TolQ/ExbB proton channel family protein n=1 Tax=Pseudemcibacter aquimaris TaxID=2857064 RepID=UPI0020135FCD|nr:MotA/TolQ/ExbB proton channel family protein [Pseudemcibacter aquimaris]MCC3861498.1 MotA/TolQ/ExbB proton channel family protein [Pseudemcibacter aquimaris]WDU58267.1 MotA/TolQ/ExbB proton channel family protein [Pseudemcibacter aquimaris]
MEQLTDFISEFFTLWQSGGILMWPLLIIAIFMYSNIFDLFSRLSGYQYDEGYDDLKSDILEKCDNKKTLKERILIIKSDHLPVLNNRLHFLTILVGVSPLMGLLGTVMGMLSTFSLMNDVGVKKADLMAGGISEALITTQIGLIIAVPALVMLVLLRSKRDKLNNFFEKLESECNRSLMQSSEVHQ